MTTATKPLPPHGTEARYKGSSTRPPCRCHTCIKGWTKAGQRRHLLRLAGRPASLTREEVAAVIAHVHTCRNAGMSQCLIARRAHVAQSTISRLLSRDNAGCLRAQGERILAVRPGDFDDISDRPALGTIRRIRGLYYAGHGPQSICQHATISLTLVTELAGADYDVVAPTTEATIRLACAALAGIPGTSRAARRRAQREQWAPLGAWDDIDDPAAVPDWTGNCGTDAGWWLHSVNEIPACDRCEAAHTRWKADRAHLSHSQRWAELARAKGAASNRGATLAADARELMRITGHNVEQIAERLGVTKAHLYQELLRHPEPDEPAVDAELAA